MKNPITGRRNRAKFDAALTQMKELEAQLSKTAQAPARQLILERLGQCYTTMRDTHDPADFPPLQAGEGTSTTQIYTDMARLAALLAYGEQRFGSHRGPFPGKYLPGVTRTERGLWDRYLASTSRRERSDLLLFNLYETTAVRLGYEAASVLNMAGWAEKKLAGSTR